MTGNTLSSGQDDHAQGIWSPAYGVVYSQLQSCIIKDNVLHAGALTALILDRGNNDDATVLVKDNFGTVGMEEW